MIQNIAKLKNIHLSYETFGKPEGKPVILIQGSGAQGLLWPKEFCIDLSSYGYYVIRYDHRDTGLSSTIDYSNNPYNLHDLAQDAIDLIDHLKISKANIVGSSMGGYIAQILGAEFANRVNTLSLMMTSLVSFSLDHVFLDTSTVHGLPLPTKRFREDLMAIKFTEPTPVGQANQLLFVWNAYNGDGLPYNQDLWLNVARQWVSRSQSTTASLNHRLAVESSSFSREDSLLNIQASTLIIHGECDPFFPIEHAYALHQKIPNAFLHIIKKMGHFFHEGFIKEVAKSIHNHISSHAL